MNSDVKDQNKRLEGVAQFLKNEPQVEAALIDLKTGALTLATIGQINLEELRQRLAIALSEIETTWNPAQINTAAHSHLQIRKLKNELLLEKLSCPTAPTFWIWREFPWPEPLRQEKVEEWKQMAALTSVCGFFLMLGFIGDQFLQLPNYFIIGCYVISMMAGGWDAALDAWDRLWQRELDIHFLMLTVACGAAAIGAWAEGALLLFLFTLSGTFEHFALFRTKREIDTLFKNAPKQATRITQAGAEETVAVSALKVGDLVRMRPGDQFPVDATIKTGQTAADESNLTGEATPVDKSAGETVFSGTINLWGSVDATVLRLASESALAKIIRLIQEARNLKAPSQRLTDRFGTTYTYLILGLVTLMFFIWWLGFGLPPFTNKSQTEYSAFYRAMTLLVVASPCALVLSIPSAILAAIASGARKGILFRGGAAIEQLAEINLVALDKTGTLTTGNLQVTQVESFPPGREKDVAQLAYSLEQRANHPIARAILTYGIKNGLDQRDVDQFQSLSGHGVKGRLQGALCVLGRRELLGNGPLAQMVAAIPLPLDGFTEVWVLHESLLGRILLQDEIRKESRNVLEALHRYGLQTVMLTGDRKEVAMSVGKDLGLSEIRFGLSPEQKVQAVEGFTRKGLKVAMIGDGVNDAPCLAAADVGVAMGVRGSGAAMEESAVILMRDRIDLFLEAYSLSKRARSVIRQNLVVSLGTVGVMVILTLGGWVSLPMGVLAHEGSTVLVCLNGLRLLLRNYSAPH